MPIAKYVCPECGMKYEKPGNCSMCSVNLIKKGVSAK